MPLQEAGGVQVVADLHYLMRRFAVVAMRRGLRMSQVRRQRFAFEHASLRRRHNKRPRGVRGQITKLRRSERVQRAR
eukprot:97350-Chlamydomonas_euryale.AAC.3